MAYTTIDDPSEYFTTTLYTGNGSDAHSITNSANSGNFKSDWLWTKNRTGTARNHSIFDSSRDVQKYLYTNATDAEATAASSLQSFDTNGFTVGTSTQVNPSGNSMVSWQWKCNGGTTTDVSASGSGNTQIIASTHQANTDAGFSIVTFTAPDVASGSNYTVSHGLGGVPELIILKSRNPTGNWHVYHKGTGNTGVTFLNTTAAFYDNIYFADTTPSSTVFTVGARTSLDPTHTAVVYCFRSIKGYSRIGKYTGIGSDNGTFVYTGFKPAWVMIKRTNAVGAWEIYDTKRAKISGSNQMENTDLQADATGAEGASTIGNGLDLLSNGFRPTTGTLYLNGAGSTYIYLAFAEHPFVSSEGTPTTAR